MHAPLSPSLCMLHDISVDRSGLVPSCHRPPSTQEGLPPPFPNWSTHFAWFHLISAFHFELSFQIRLTHLEML